MGNDADWWTRKLAGGKPSVPQLPGYPVTLVPQAHAAPSPAAYVAQPESGTQQTQFFSYDEHGRQVPDDGHVELLHNAAAQTGGSARMRASQGRCPECNGSNYYQRTTTENGVPLRVPLAPRCFDCGYPMIQAGSKTGAATAAGARRGEAPRHSRQLPANHDVEVILENGGTMVFPAAPR